MLRGNGSRRVMNVTQRMTYRTKNSTNATGALFRRKRCINIKIFIYTRTLKNETLYSRNVMAPEFLRKHNKRN